VYEVTSVGGEKRIRFRCPSSIVQYLRAAKQLPSPIGE
jgi:hypothetical protein